jgi:hypothetical protein
MISRIFALKRGEKISRKFLVGKNVKTASDRRFYAVAGEIF